MKYTIKELLTLLPPSSFTVSSVKDNWQSQTIESIVWDWQKATAQSLYICIENEEFQAQHIQKNSLFHVQDAYQQGTRLFLTTYEAKLDLPDATIIRYNGNLNQVLSLFLSKIYNDPFDSFHTIGVTGTNGKTTTTQFLDTLYRAHQQRTGVIGTISIFYPSKTELPDSLSTPMATELFSIADKMKQDKVDTLFMEVTSHSMVFDRVHAISFHGGIFTNLTQDHLDFHKTMDHYAQSKAKFFSTLGKNKPAFALINLDDTYAQTFIASLDKEAIKAKRLTPYTYSTAKKSADFYAELVELSPSSLKFNLYIKQNFSLLIYLPITGLFNLYNALAAAACAYLDNIPLSTIQRAFRSMGQISGRFEHVEIDNKPYNIYIDYAHTPDALSSILQAVKQQTQNKLHLVFGCGGNRDKTKRPLMADEAAQFADYIWITSDNPRKEDPMAICMQIYDAIPEDRKKHTQVICDRKEAIQQAIDCLQEGDTLLIAGKGHETYQVIGDTKYPFSDRKVVIEHIQQTN